MDRVLRGRTTVAAMVTALRTVATIRWPTIAAITAPTRGITLTATSAWFATTANHCFQALAGQTNAIGSLDHTF